MNIKKISEFGLVAGLMSLGYSPIERQKNGKRIEFLFESDDEFERLCNDYYNGRMSVDAQNYSNTMKSIKASIYRMQK